MPMLVQMKPYNPRIGLTLKTFTFRGVTLTNQSSGAVANPWYTVSDEIAKHLKSKRIDDDPNLPCPFIVATHDEAAALEAAEGRKLDARTTAEFERLGGVPGRGDMSTNDLASSGGLGPAGMRVIGGSNGDPNLDNSQNHFRPGGSNASDRGPKEVHAGDANPAVTGTPPNPAAALGTPQNPIDAGGGTIDQGAGAQGAQTGGQGPAQGSGKSTPRGGGKPPQG